MSKLFSVSLENQLKIHLLGVIISSIAVVVCLPATIINLANAADFQPVYMFVFFLSLWGGSFHLFMMWKMSIKADVVYEDEECSLVGNPQSSK